VLTCPTCRAELPDGFDFCGKCGTALAAPAAHPEERKVVTTLFCDLVGFTALSGRADPEDVDALLRRYCDMARRIVQSYGGTVEKFIGDAVVAVFGVPAAHEDDPERAVRAALRIVEEAERSKGLGDEPLRLRVGVNTGEALVRLDVTPGSGEGFLTGDAVNVAARLQGLAPPMGVVVGEPTYELTHRAFVYEDLEPVTVKGKSEPLAVWRAVAPLARTGATRLEEATPFVGRQVELGYLMALFDKAADSASPQVALVVGEPGIGKSRLIAELFARVDAGERVVTWRQGACLPYGEGVTFWALAEILKAHAGILETDDREKVDAKLDAVLPEGEDREWFRQRLRALLGLEAAKAEREENFTAWLRFLEELASRGPTVLVIEDLHWGDDALLDFVEYFTSHVADVPLFLIATARPELFETHPAFAAAGRVNRVVLEPLSAKETVTLIDSLLQEITADVRATIARHSEGNPFYAEESARLIRDTVGLGSPVEGAATVAATVRAVIAARLDTLPPELKAVLADASVVGQVFWDGALTALGERSAGDVEAALGGLIARQLVHRVRAPSMAGEREFAFGHSLSRDVAYGELPRAVRARKHAAVAAWIEQKAGDRADDLAELLAHHYATALDLARAAGEVALSESLTEAAVRYLTLAGDRAWPLDVSAAENLYARALEIAGPDSPRRSALLVRWAKAAGQLGREAETVGPLEEAVTGLHALGETRAAAFAQVLLGEALPKEDDARWLQVQAGAVAQLEVEGPSPELLAALNRWVGNTWGNCDPQATLQVADRAIAVAKQLGVPPEPRAICYRGCARCDMGDVGGIGELRRCLELVRAGGTQEYAGDIFWAAGCDISMFEGFQAGLEIAGEGLGYAQRRGDVGTELTLRAEFIWASEPLGEWDAVLRDAPALESLLEAASYDWLLATVALNHLRVLVHRGQADEAEALTPLFMEAARGQTGHTVAACSTTAAAAKLAAGEIDDARSLLKLADIAYRRPGGHWWAAGLPLAVRIALAAGDGGLAERLADSLVPLQPVCRHALTAAKALVTEARGEHATALAAFADAAGAWHDFGMPNEEAQALFGEGRCLMALGRAPEAAAPLTAAREIFAKLKAKPALEETAELLAEAQP
jgi:class 3 adenylate cyclase